MSSLTDKERQVLQDCMVKAAKGRRIAAACIYGSRVAGYARPDSDIDLLLVLENYPYKVKYAYMKESGVQVSSLIVDSEALERDAKGAYLGEFVVGRLLHVYEPVQNAQLLRQVERDYKRRVLLEELRGLVRSAGLLAADLSFSLRYIAFSKIRHRMSLYPNATYSYYRTYTDEGRNLELAMQGYREALSDIIKQDPELLAVDADTLRLSESRLQVARGEPSLLLTKRLHEFSSYFIHSYAGRRMYHLAVSEAQSKIRRHLKQPVDLPLFMSCPACAYWKLPEGLMIVDSRKQNWLDEVSRKNGITGYSLKKRRLGNQNSRTLLYSLDGLHLAVKKLAKTKGVKWAALGMWTAYLKSFQTSPLIRLGTEYKAHRHLRELGLKSPAIEAVVLDERLLVTRYIPGPTIANMMKESLKRPPGPEIREVGRQIATVHRTGSCFGNIKPKNVIVSDGLWFTDLEQFVFEKGDPAWDVVQFLCWGLKGTRNARAAAAITREFLDGYDNVDVTKKLSKSRRYLQTFYPVLSPQVAQAIRKELT